MLIKSNKYYFVILYFIGLSIIPVGIYIKDQDNLIYFFILEIAALIICILLFFLWKKKQILFESNDDGILIMGSKEDKYDPDFIKYEEINECNIEGKRLILDLKYDRVVILQNLGKDLNKCYNEIIKQKNNSV